MKKTYANQARTFSRAAGFTITELLVVVSLMAIVGAIATPKFVTMKGQLAASRDVRMLVATLGEVRAEALRLRTDVRVTFTSTAMHWDIYDDGTEDGTFALSNSSAWVGGTPSAIVFNGLGLTRGVATTQTITVNNRGERLAFSINRNGYVWI